MFQETFSHIVLMKFTSGQSKKDSNDPKKIVDSMATDNSVYLR